MWCDHDDVGGCDDHNDYCDDNDDCGGGKDDEDDSDDDDYEDVMMISQVFYFKKSFTPTRVVPLIRFMTCKACDLDFFSHFNHLF